MRFLLVALLCALSYAQTDCVPDETATKATCPFDCGTVVAVVSTQAVNGGSSCVDYNCVPGDGKCPFGSYMSTWSTSRRHPNQISIPHDLQGGNTEIWPPFPDWWADLPEIYIVNILDDRGHNTYEYPNWMPNDLSWLGQLTKLTYLHIHAHFESLDLSVLSSLTDLEYFAYSTPPQYREDDPNFKVFRPDAAPDLSILSQLTKLATIYINSATERYDGPNNHISFLKPLRQLADFQCSPYCNLVGDIEHFKDIGLDAPDGITLDVSGEGRRTYGGKLHGNLSWVSRHGNLRKLVINGHRGVSGPVSYLNDLLGANPKMARWARIQLRFNSLTGTIDSMVPFMIETYVGLMIDDNLLTGALSIEDFDAINAVENDRGQYDREGRAFEIQQNPFLDCGGAMEYILASSIDRISAQCPTSLPGTGYPNSNTRTLYCGYFYVAASDAGPNVCGQTRPPTPSPVPPPTHAPTFTPSFCPTFQPTANPTHVPTFCPSNYPTSSNPSASPITSLPSTSPTSSPTSSPTTNPSSSPTSSPSSSPFSSPSTRPTTSPTSSPSSSPTSFPSFSPSASPSSSPTTFPSSRPTTGPSSAPSSTPTTSPTWSPSSSPTSSPSALPSSSPTSSPSTLPSSSPTSSPSTFPSSNPTSSPSTSPSSSPSSCPSSSPTTSPSSSPTTAPSTVPSSTPTASPTTAPTTEPTSAPSTSPSTLPTEHPSTSPTSAPTFLVYSPMGKGDCVSPGNRTFSGYWRCTDEILTCDTHCDQTLNCYAYTVSQGSSCEGIGCTIHVLGAQHFTVPIDFDFFIPGEEFDSRVLWNNKGDRYCHSNATLAEQYVQVQPEQDNNDTQEFLELLGNIGVAILVWYLCLWLLYCYGKRFDRKWSAETHRESTSSIVDVSGDWMDAFFGSENDCSCHLLFPDFTDTNNLNVDDMPEHTNVIMLIVGWLWKLPGIAKIKLLMETSDLSFDIWFFFDIRGDYRKIAMLAVPSIVISMAILLVSYFIDIASYKNGIDQRIRKIVKLRWSIFVLTPVEDIVQIGIAIWVMTKPETIFSWVAYLCVITSFISLFYQFVAMCMVINKIDTKSQDIELIRKRSEKLSSAENHGKRSADAESYVSTPSGEEAPMTILDAIACQQKSIDTLQLKQDQILQLLLKGSSNIDVVAGRGGEEIEDEESAN